MKFKTLPLLFILGTLLLPLSSQISINKDQLEALRREAELTRRGTLATKLELSEGETTSFWPIYDTFRKEINDVNQQSVDLIIEMVNHYADIKDKLAEEINEKIISLDEKKLSIRNNYIKKFTKIMSPRKVTKFYVIERILDSRLSAKIVDTLRMIEPLPYNP
jgi:hypothetical protein